MCTFLDLDFRIQTSESGSGSDLLCRIRISSQHFRIPVPGGQKLENNLDKFILFRFFILLIFVNSFIGLFVWASDTRGIKERCTQSA